MPHSWIVPLGALNISGIDTVIVDIDVDVYRVGQQALLCFIEVCNNGIARTVSFRCLVSNPSLRFIDDNATIKMVQRIVRASVD